MKEVINIFLNNLANAGPSREVLVCSLLFTLVMSLIMGITYRLVQTELSYNSKFNINLMMMAFLSNVLILLIQDNPLLSLGALGSLSICRIRLNTKDPRDLGFVFWALSIGITSAMGAFLPCIIATLSMSTILIVLCRMLYNRKRTTLVIRGERNILVNVQSIFNNMRGITVQSKNIFENTFELVYEINANKNVEDNLINKLDTIDGLHGVNILAPETKAA
ncbi:DUF4956 domain-containing protein [Anaerofustis sp.]|uniref:DUF4956 domain-containing protein n=1 Tax=Anaerofustis sp. TaxID=1872517 RepID=UPI0025B84884|nr:DUF4956 domain-containing protein [Anaerofustis sp.]